MKRVVIAIVIVLSINILAFSKPLSQPQGVAFSSDGKLLAVSDTGNNRVLIYRKSGDGWQKFYVITDIEKPYGLLWFKQDRLAICEGGKGRVLFYQIREKETSRETFIKGLHFPTGISIWRGKLFVADGEADKIVIFDISSYPSISSSFKEFGKPGNTRGELSHPTGIGVAENGTIFVADEGNGRVAIWRYDTFSDTVEPSEPYELPGFWSSRAVLIVKPINELWVLNSFAGDLRRIDIGDLSGQNWRIFNGFVDANQRDLSAVYSGHRTPQGNPSRNSIFSEGKVPPVLALGRLGNMYEPVNAFDISPSGQEIAIATGDKVLVLPLDARFQFLIPERPTVQCTEREAIISWLTPISTETKVEIAKQWEGKWKVFSIPGERKRHRVAVGDLEPATGYLLRIPIPGACEIKDDSSSIPLRSFEFAFATRPSAGETTFIRIPVAVLVYADVIKTDTLTPDVPPAPPISRSYLDYIRREVEVAQLFYWCNSRMKLWLDCDIFINTQRIYIDKDQPGYDGNGFWRDKPIEDLKELLRLKGRSLDEYPAVVVITCERRWDNQKKQYVFTPSGGGTYGVDARPGSSHFLGGHDPAWLFVHEFHHQLDSQYAESGYPEYPFNHFSITPEGFSDAFGGNYDGNAWILRNWHYGDLSLWFTNKFAKVVSAKDEDGDGIPDDCPLVPLDEKRFGSDPKKKDTDEDGLDDMGEVLASEWVYETLVWPDDWNARAKYVMPDPRNPDSDGDGINDGYDPLPIYACRPTIGTDENHIWFWIDEDTAEVPKPYPVSQPEKPLHGDIYLWHNGEWLNFRFLFNLPVPRVHIQLDCNADGLYVGADNLDVWVTAEWTTEPQTRIRTEVTNGSSREKWPFSDPTLSPPSENMKASARFLEEGKYEITFSIKQTPQIGLMLNIGKKIGLSIEVLAEPNSPRLLSVFQPQQLIPLLIE